MVPPVLGQLGRERERERKKKKKAPSSTFVPAEFHWIPAPLAYTLKSINESPYMTQAIFKVLPLYWDSEQVSLCMSPSRVGFQFPLAL